MLALLQTYENEKIVEIEVVEIPDDYDGNPYGDTVPFSVGSNQTIVTIND